MKEPHTLPIVSVRDLVRRPAEVLDRVARGERFIVCRHRRPVATLQPIEGWVVCGSSTADTLIIGRRSPISNSGASRGAASTEGWS